MSALEQIQNLNHSLFPAPSNFTASHPSPRGILLSWEQPPLSPSIQIYILFLWLFNAKIATNYSINDTLTYRVQSLEPYSLYQTTLTALMLDENFTQFTPVITFRTNESIPISFPPIKSVTAISSNTINVTWSHLPLVSWRGAPYKYRITWHSSDTGENGYKFVPYTSTSFEITGLQNGAIYSISLSALTEFGGEGPSSPSSHLAIPTAMSPLSTPLQYTAIPAIAIFAICLSYTVYVFKRLFCTFQGLSASWFKQQKKHYQLLTQSDDKIVKNARKSPLLLRNTKTPEYSLEYTNRAPELYLEISPLDAPPKARSAVTLQSDGSYSQLPTPIRPVSALNVLMHTNSNRKQASSTLDPRTQQHPSSAHSAQRSSSTADRGVSSNYPEINRINSEERFYVNDNRK